MKKINAEGRKYLSSHGNNAIYFYTQIVMGKKEKF
jgi:hypothetical protein